MQHVKPRKLLGKESKAKGRMWTQKSLGNGAVRKVNLRDPLAHHAKGWLNLYLLS